MKPALKPALRVMVGERSVGRTFFNRQNAERVAKNVGGIVVEATPRSAKTIVKAEGQPLGIDGLIDDLKSLALRTLKKNESKFKFEKYNLSFIKDNPPLVKNKPPFIKDWFTNIIHKKPF